MHSILFANCLVSGVGGAMGVPVALPSGFPMGNMVLSHHFQFYTTIILMPGIGRSSFAFGFADSRLRLPHHPCMCSFCCGFGHASVIFTILVVVAFTHSFFSFLPSADSSGQMPPAPAIVSVPLVFPQMFWSSCSSGIGVAATSAHVPLGVVTPHLASGFALSTPLPAVTSSSFKQSLPSLAPLLAQ